MRIFVTGATGFIGSAVVQNLRAAGHEVLGLTRSEAGATALTAAGAKVQRGSLEDLNSLKDGAAQADGVIHLAFNHDFSRFAQNCEDDRRVIQTLGAALAGSNRPLVVTSGTAIASIEPGKLAREDSPTVSSQRVPRAATEEAAAAVRAAGGNVTVVRLPQVHDTHKQGLISYAIGIARQQGVFAYVGDGQNRWAAAPVADVARLYRLAIEQAAPGAVYHAVAEEGVRLKDIAEVVGRRLALPVKSIPAEAAQTHFGWLATFAAHDMPASSEQTRRQLGWQPTGPTLLADLEQLQL